MFSPPIKIKKAFVNAQTMTKALILLNDAPMYQRHHAIVQVLASQGDEVTLFHALFSTWTVYLLIVSPLLCGSNPYPCGSLTYRSGFYNHI